MFVRIVKMSFKPDKIKEFLNNFEESKLKIKNFEGCSLLELYRDKTDSTVFFTYSYWNTELDLDNYRNSRFFKEVWSKTKLLFDERPIAWSVDKIVSLK